MTLVLLGCQHKGHGLCIPTSGAHRVHLGRVDKPDGDANACEYDESEEAGGSLVVACRDAAVGFQLAARC
jgi:hypothetical protein